MQSAAPNMNRPRADLREKIMQAISALSELSDALPGEDRNPILEQLEVLHIEHYSEPVSYSALGRSCKKMSDLLEQFKIGLG
jgi:hypothetical protein